MSRIRSIIRKYIFERYLSSLVIASIDIAMSVVSIYLVLTAMRIVIPQLGIDFRDSMLLAAISIIASIISILIVKTNHRIIRHTTMADVLHLAAAALLKQAIFGATMLAMSMHPKVVITIITLDFFVLFCAEIFTRIFMILIYDHIKQSTLEDSGRKRIFIYGSGDKSTALNKRLENSKHYKTMGFIQYGAVTGHATLQGLALFSFRNMDEETLQATFNSYGVATLLFPNYESLKEERERLVTMCTHLKIKILVVPPIDEVRKGALPQNAIREIRIEDLLGRDEIKISMKEIIENFHNKTVLVTGAAGSIGSELCRQLAGFGVRSLIMMDNAETPMHNIRLELEERYEKLDIHPIVSDVRYIERLDYIFSKFKPQVVFHAAAYKHVPLMEENPCEAVLVNVVGSRNVADMCIKHGVDMMVMISTDKAVNPTNIMGCTKRLAEIYVQSLGEAVASGSVEGHTKFVTTRFGNVLGSNGSVIPRFREQILKGGPVTVTHPEITRFFMTIPEACRLVMEAATMNLNNRIVVFDMGRSMKIVELAERMIELAGFKAGEDIKIEFTGLRPGEKLYEEVLSNKENTEETSHDKIRIARVREYNYAEVAEAIGKLQELARHVQIMDLVSSMKKIVPEFKSQNSRFEELDK